MLTSELMQKVKQLQIYTARAVNEVFAGEYSSAFKGRGMEFAEVREYQPGDDVRTIDWNVTARCGTPFVKRYVEERELTLMLAVDLSSSGDFGSVNRTKIETAAEFCALLAFAATRNNDKVGLMIFTDHVELFIPPKKGTQHVLRVIRELLDFQPRGRGTNVQGALDHLGRVLKKSAIVFLVSDFLPIGTSGHHVSNAAKNGASSGWAGRELEQSLQILNRRHDVIAACMTDPRECELPRVGIVEVQDPETGEAAVLDTSSRRVRREYERRAAARLQSLESSMRRCGVDYLQVQTERPYIHQLMQLFKRREQRR